MRSTAVNQTREGTASVAHDLWKLYGDRPVVQGVSFQLNPGEVLGLLGANGAGKTTTVGMLYGGVMPSRGFVRLGDIHVHTNGRRARVYSSRFLKEPTAASFGSISKKRGRPC